MSIFVQINAVDVLADNCGSIVTNFLLGNL